MVEFKSFQVFVMLMIPFTAVTQHFSEVPVRVGDDTTLPCENIKDYQDNCFNTTWTFSGPSNRQAVTLFEYGKFQKEAAAKSDRLSVTEKCSLVIKKVTDEDAHRYNCRQFDEGKIVTDSYVDLIVIQRDNVAPPKTITTKLPTTIKGKTKATKASTTPTITIKRTTKATKATMRPATTTDPAAGGTSPNSNLPAILISVAVALAALSIIIVSVIKWKKAEGNNSQFDDNTVDPPDGVFYTSIRYKKKTKSKGRVQSGDDTVTYSTLNTSSTSAGASTDPKKLYASINKTST